MDVDLLSIKLTYKSKVLENGCRIWFGAITHTNTRALVPYGHLTMGKKKYYVHRLALYLKNGKMPGTCSHRCHNSLCIEPTHLVEESQKINNGRKKCRAEGECSLDHEPVCMVCNTIGKLVLDLYLEHCV